MSRARLIGGLLAAILLACAVVIYLDQKNNAGSGSSGTVSAPANPGSVPAPAPQPSGSGGYGDLK